MNTTVALTPYEALGGEAGIKRLVSRFYELMEELPEAYGVRKIHPESLQGASDLLFEFLSGWLGGPPLYTEKKGHPRLRMRHAPYEISQVMRDEWMLCMTQTIKEQVADADFQLWLVNTIGAMADHLINTEDSHGCHMAAPISANNGS